MAQISIAEEAKFDFELLRTRLSSIWMVTILKTEMKLYMLWWNF